MKTLLEYLTSTSILFSLISLTLGLMGVFKETSIKDKDTGKKIPTVWGYLVVVLLSCSAGAAIYFEIKKHEAGKKEAEIQLAESKQQKLLSLIAVSSDFELSKKVLPMLSLSFRGLKNNETTGELIDDNYEKFPGFGLPGISYSLDLDLQEDKGGNIEGLQVPFSMNGDSVVEARIQAELGKDQTANMTIFPVKDPIDDSQNYLWKFSSYKSLTDLLLDFQEGRNIGSISFRKEKGSLTDKDIKHIEQYIKRDTTWSVEVYVNTKDAAVDFVPLKIPVLLSKDEAGDALRYVFKTGTPKLGEKRLWVP